MLLPFPAVRNLQERQKKKPKKIELRWVLLGKADAWGCKFEQWGRQIESLALPTRLWSVQLTHTQSAASADDEQFSFFRLFITQNCPRVGLQTFHCLSVCLSVCALINPRQSVCRLFICQTTYTTENLLN